jgi:DNA-binding PadR family transcriptional regulator
MGQRDYLGGFEQVVLLAVLRLRDNAYGMTVRREIMERTGRDVAIGAVYSTLDRLEAKGFTRSTTTKSTERPGRAKRCFIVTAQGVRALQEVREDLDALWHGVPVLA